MKAYSVIAMMCAMLIACQESNDNQEDPVTDQETSDICPWDSNDSQDAAETILLEDFPAEGYICPQGDQDWYSFTVPANNELVTIKISLEAPLAPINPTYAIWSVDTQTVVATPDADEVASAQQALQVTHKLPAGTYNLVVKDSTGAHEDIRHAYSVMVAVAADLDQQEENNNDQQAVTMPAVPTQGYINYRGDQDWFKVTVGDRALLDIQFTMDQAPLQPGFAILNQEQEELFSFYNEASSREPTDISKLVSTPQAGTYYIVVQDMSGILSDSQHAYTLDVSVIQDPDSLEPNDSATQATQLDALECLSSWSSYVSQQGYLASSVDSDWYKLGLQSCSFGVLEVEIVFDDMNNIPDDLQLSLRVLRTVSNHPCSADQECQELNKTCQNDLDCTMYGNNCMQFNTCGGAGICLPETVCAANLYTQHQAGEISSGTETVVNPLRGRISVAIPVRDISVVYFVVSDFHADSYSLTMPYTIRARVVDDPDLHEINEAYTAGPPDSTQPIGEHTALAKQVAVYDCTGDGATDLPTGVVEGCCSSMPWTSGYLSYTYDQDWFEYAHPCPGEDCMVKIYYQLDAGPVDFYMRVLRSNTGWFDNITSTSDVGTQTAIDSYFGGLNSDDYCFYAYNGHSGSPYWYRLGIRDTAYVSSSQPLGGTWDWSTTQQYRFCIEKVYSGCMEPPCVYYEEGGCDAP